MACSPHANAQAAAAASLLEISCGRGIDVLILSKFLYGFSMLERTAGQEAPSHSNTATGINQIRHPSWITSVNAIQVLKSGLPGRCRSMALPTSAGLQLYGFVPGRQLRHDFCLRRSPTRFWPIAQAASSVADEPGFIRNVSAGTMPCGVTKNAGVPDKSSSFFNGMIFRLLLEGIKRTCDQRFL